MAAAQYFLSQIQHDSILNYKSLQTLSADKPASSRYERFANI